MWEKNDTLLKLEGVAKRYGSRSVLRDFSLSVVPGEVVAITGANGSGKSTLLKIVAGLLRATHGKITLLREPDAAERRFHIGYAGPDLHFYNELTAHENLAFLYQVRTGTAQNRAVRERRLEAVGLGERGDDLVAAYSSGMRQRLRLAFATGHEVPLLLLDEPSLALDEKGVALVGEMIAAQRAGGGATLLATNDPREAALGDRTVALGA
ncbi:MAG: ABC transporter ATP-binding protein [Cytophagales bacterium]|nr:ABC transporter ATP-binding protein [Armatimonadota bacterium]